jgi:mono/diheme cytochrome c family protein
MDDAGRLYYSPNSDPLRVDVFPPHYAARNPHHPRTVGIYAQAARDHRVWPIRVTPGINRGYRKGMLEDGRLVKFTAACGPAIYRDDALGPAYAGNAFVCEPSGNLVKRYVLESTTTSVTATNAHEGAEFLASTDERFRPVNLAVGPDGALYVVDFYRGIIQHRIFMTTFLRRQLLDRGLDAPAGLGRIYRVRAADRTATAPVDLTALSSAALVAMLSSSSGWQRDTAQRLLVERRAREVAGDLRSLSMRAEPTVALHALWTLEGIGALDIEDALRACRHPDARVRAAGIRLCEAWLDRGRVLDALGRLIGDPDVAVRVQLAFTLGEGWSPTAAHLLARLATRDADRAVVRSAVCTSLRDREVTFLEHLAREWSGPGAGRREVIAAVTDCVLRDGRPEPVTRLVELIGDGGPEATWFAPVVIERLARSLRIDDERPRRLTLGWEPMNWSTWLIEPATVDGPPVHAIDGCLTWPGRRAGAPPARAMTAAQRARFRRGRGLFALHCASCHQPSGQGQAGLAPSLVGTPGALGSGERLARIVTGGLTGRLTVDDTTFDLVMPKLDLRDDESVAAILTYVRRAWGNDADPVDPETVTAARAESDAREGPWSVDELRGLD